MKIPRVIHLDDDQTKPELNKKKQKKIKTVMKMEEQKKYTSTTITMRKPRIMLRGIAKEMFWMLPFVVCLRCQNMIPK